MMRFNEFKFKENLNNLGACLLWKHFDYQIDRENTKLISMRFELTEDDDTLFRYRLIVYKEKEAHIASESFDFESDSINDFYKKMNGNFAHDREILYKAIKDSLDEILPEAVEVEPIGELEVEENENF